MQSAECRKNALVDLRKKLETANSKEENSILREIDKIIAQNFLEYVNR